MNSFKILSLRTIALGLTISASCFYCYAQTTPAAAPSPVEQNPAPQAVIRRASASACAAFLPNQPTVKSILPLGTARNAEKVVFRNSPRAIIRAMGGAFYANLFRQPRLLLGVVSCVCDKATQSNPLFNAGLSQA